MAMEMAFLPPRVTAGTRWRVRRVPDSRAAISDLMRKRPGTTGSTKTVRATMTTTQTATALYLTRMSVSGQRVSKARDSSQGVTAGMKCSRLQRGCSEAQRSSPVLPTLGTTVWTATAAGRMTLTKTAMALLRWPMRRHTSPRFLQRPSQFPQQTARMLRRPKARATGFLSPSNPRTSIPMLRRPGTTESTKTAAMRTTLIKTAMDKTQPASRTWTGPMVRTAMTAMLTMSCPSSQGWLTSRTSSRCPTMRFFRPSN